VNRNARWGIILLSSLLIVWFLVKQSFHVESKWAIAMLPSALALLFGLVVFSTTLYAGQPTIGIRILRFWPLQAAGKVSYAAYVVHVPLMAATLPWITGTTAAVQGSHAVIYFLCGLATTFLLAAVSWWLIESRILRYKDVLAP
jgi:peptidoglycan/LPS O-acetylase OafA/YrhL